MTEKIKSRVSLTLQVCTAVLALLAAIYAYGQSDGASAGNIAAEMKLAREHRSKVEAFMSSGDRYTAKDAERDSEIAALRNQKYTLEQMLKERAVTDGQVLDLQSTISNELKNIQLAIAAQPPDEWREQVTENRDEIQRLRGFVERIWQKIAGSFDAGGNG